MKSPLIYLILFFAAVSCTPQRGGSGGGNKGGGNRGGGNRGGGGSSVSRTHSIIGIMNGLEHGLERIDHLCAFSFLRFDRSFPINSN